MLALCPFLFLLDKWDLSDFMCRGLLLPRGRERMDWYQHWESGLDTSKYHIQRYTASITTSLSLITYLPVLIYWDERDETCPFHRRIPGRSQGCGPTADWSPDTDPPAGPLWPRLHRQLWFCTHRETSPHWYHYYLIVCLTRLLHLTFFPWCKTRV